MLDINIIIPPLVEDIVRLEPQYPEIVPEFPLAILTPLDMGSGTIISGEERLAAVSFQVDVLHRRTLTFSAAIDEHTGLVYRR